MHRPIFFTLKPSRQLHFFWFFLLWLVLLGLLSGSTCENQDFVAIAEGEISLETNTPQILIPIEHPYAGRNVIDYKLVNLGSAQAKLHLRAEVSSDTELKNTNKIIILDRNIELRDRMTSDELGTGNIVNVTLSCAVDDCLNCVESSCNNFCNAENLDCFAEYCPQRCGECELYFSECIQECIPDLTEECPQCILNNCPSCSAPFCESCQERICEVAYQFSFLLIQLECRDNSECSGNEVCSSGSCKPDLQASGCGVVNNLIVSQSTFGKPVNYRIFLYFLVILVLGLPVIKSSCKSKR